MSSLIEKKCIPCEGGMPPLSKESVEKYAKEMPAWSVIDAEKIQREFKLKDFKAAMHFVNQVAEIAEAEQHHPDIYIFYNLVRIELTTHAIKGLSENDFIIAAKIDALV